MSHTFPRECRPRMAHTWGCLSTLPHAYQWGEYLVQLYARSDGVIVYMANALPSGALAVLFEFPSETVAVVLPDLHNPAFGFERMSFPGLAPDRCVFVLQLHRPQLAEHFMAFADEIVADLIYGPNESAPQLQLSLDSWCRLFCGNVEHRSREEADPDIPF